MAWLLWIVGALKRVAWLAVSAGIVTGALMLLIAVEHNPQGELIDEVTGAVDFPYALGLHFSWFVVGSIIAGIAISIVWGSIAVIKSVSYRI
ncbi:MAG: hypothetical protein J2P48_21400 [Alphaproteobacteria bacterium]|nr:hypothetical protein [Alphaproteobacteria bacterium]MBO0758853.1 hypothetical protein [Bradyrhizobiaceae bacterium]